MSTYRPVLLSVLALAVSLTACSSNDPSVSAPSGPATTGASGAGGTSLMIENFAFSPEPLTVAPGATISVTNKDSPEHDVTSDEKNLFKTKLLGKDETITFKAPAKAGTYSYVCSVHASMKGSLVVK